MCSTEREREGGKETGEWGGKRRKREGEGRREKKKEKRGWGFSSVT